MELCWPQTLSLVISYVFLIGVCCTALDVCQKKDDCSCELLDGKQINIRSLGYEGSQAPRFPYVTAGPGSWRYAFNPCYAWTDTAACQNVVACQEGDPNLKFAIGSASPATWKQENNKYVVEYSSSGDGQIRTSVVTLECDQTKDEPTLIRLGSRTDPQFPATTFFDFTLTSKCCCPGACNGPPVHPTASGDTGISLGSVLCIIVSVLIIVYVVGGVIFMKFVRHAEGTELIPNRDIWTGLFGSIMDGCVFIFTCGKKSGYDTMK